MRMCMGAWVISRPIYSVYPKPNPNTNTNPNPNPKPNPSPNPYR